MKENIVFLHGFGGSKEIWTWQKNYFFKKNNVLVLDLPGHGDKGWHDETLEDIVDDVVCSLKKADVVTPSVFVASSFGGLVVLKLYQRYPLLVSKIVLAGALPKFTQEDGYCVGLNDIRIDKLKEQLRNNSKGALEIFIRSLYTYKERVTEQYSRNKELLKMVRKPDEKALDVMLDILKITDLRYVLKEIKVPVCFIFGDQDYICPLSIIDVLKKINFDMSFYTIRNCGHLPFFSYPKEFNQILENFIEGVL